MYLNKSVSFFKEKLNYQTRFFKNLSGSIYAIFMTHASAVVSLAYLFKYFDFHPLIKLTVVVSVVIPVCFLIGVFIKRIPIIEKIF